MLRGEDRREGCDGEGGGGGGGAVDMAWLSPLFCFAHI